MSNEPMIEQQLLLYEFAIVTVTLSINILFSEINTVYKVNIINYIFNIKTFIIIDITYWRDQTSN
jgi:hypothetical protein